ncbi:MAG: DegT/DnrJ/EryC1/StrS family aminotransferase [Candidatus Riflebacteria bacterium]|nr:DegT/DnrJ/EryC1/StrS family aminotransferase [Candidatus Riflebacteria bacterium]
MEVKCLDLQAQYARIEKEVQEAVAQVFREHNFVLGQPVTDFENELARYLGCPHVVGVASGTDALIVAFMALGVGPGDAVITTPYSFFATASAVSRVGARPIFLDIDPVTCNLDLGRVEAFLSTCRWSKSRKGKVLKDPTGKLIVKAIEPVHLYGLACDMTRIDRIAGEYNLAVVEDTAQGIGSNHGGVKVGTWGDFGCFSFYPTKNLGGCGDGGALATKDEELARQARMIREHGSSPRYIHHTLGMNSRLDTLQAAVLRVKLKYIEQWNDERRQRAATYGRMMEDAGLVARTPDQVTAGLLTLPPLDRGNEHNFHQFVVRSTRRDHLARTLKAESVGHAVYYPLPLHHQPVYKKMGFDETGCPNAVEASRQTLALPIYPELTSAHQEAVVAALSKALL